MSAAAKVYQRIIDPVFYRRTMRDMIRPFRFFHDSPKPLILGAVNVAVVLVAHPDDETFCSGLICDLVTKGVTVELVCLTRGEGGPTGGYERSKLGEVREREMRESCSVLGISEVTFLNYIDPLASSNRLYAPDVSISVLADQLKPHLKKADLIICHGSNGEYWHPAHLLVHDAVFKAVNRGRNRVNPLSLTFLARQPNHRIPRMVNWDDEADFFIDVTNYREIRESALACHESQLGLFGRFAGGSYQDFIDLTSLETYHQA